MLAVARFAVLGAHAAMIANFPKRPVENLGPGPRARLDFAMMWDAFGASTAAISSAAIGRIRAAAITAPTSSPAPSPKAPPVAESRGPVCGFCCRSPVWKSSMTGIMGLAGTGSKSLRARELFVPEWMAISDAEFLDNTGLGKNHAAARLAKPLPAAKFGSLNGSLSRTPRGSRLPGMLKWNPSTSGRRRRYRGRGQQRDALGVGQ